ncbi:hypothetical protein BXZ70DRAFT_926554 [Cristinia sonorae]|uniref:Uncharacterized protein n=1 Tax=Cristinia sonorae TaxID=1940300 RepID=A0A8K0UTC9_9AGAR|nr:hypothetical protein BXZ70DRAFT_926554 [Cristinia sonorae]
MVCCRELSATANLQYSLRVATSITHADITCSQSRCWQLVASPPSCVLLFHCSSTLARFPETWPWKQGHQAVPIYSAFSSHLLFLHLPSRLMTTTTNSYALLTPPPAKEAFLHLSESSDNIVGPPQSWMPAIDMNAPWPKGHRIRDKSFSGVQRHHTDKIHIHSPYGNHVHSRSLSFNHPRQLATIGHARHSPKGDDVWSIRTVVDENQFDSDSEPRDGGHTSEGEVDGYDSEDISQTTYVSSFRDDPPSNTSPTCHRLVRARTRSLGQWDGAGQTRAGQPRASWRAPKNEQLRWEDFLPLQEIPEASPATVSLTESHAQRMPDGGVRPRAPRRHMRFAPVDPTRRHAMYISPLVWPADGSPQGGASSDVSGSPVEVSPLGDDMSSDRPSANSSKTKWFRKSFAKRALKLHTKNV